MEGEPHQAKALYYYFIPPGMRPTFTVDVSGYFEKWMEALACHKTQFHNPDKPKPKSSVPGVAEYIGTMSQTHGWAIGARHAQSFLATSPLRITDPMDLVREIQPRP